MSKIRGPKSEIKGIKLLHKDTHKKYNDFSLQNGKLQLDHPPKFLELSPGDFFLFPELKLHTIFIPIYIINVEGEYPFWGTEVQPKLDKLFYICADV